jgi:two-component system, chemotaxis family, protein-glutamate methylesterase/glutaminase
MSLAVAAPSPAAVLAHDPIRVMVVDDAVVVRGMVARWIEAEPDMQIVASLRGGREAIEQVERRNPDVVILDVTMPDIDGITALPRLLEKKRDLVVLMASTLTRRNAEISLRALQLGAADYIPKPESSREFSTSLSFRRELIDKIRALGSRRKRGPIGARIIAPSAFIAPARGEQRASEIELEAPILDARSLDARSSPVFGPAAEPGRILLRPFPPTTPRVLLIGSSTGGPQALNALLGVIGQVIDTAPVLITQHMPPTFTAILAEHLTRASGRPAGEAVAGELVRPGRIYIAPGGQHMRVVRRDGEPAIALDDGPVINFCKPAVDPLFSSAAAVWGPWVLATVLTGMGSDGTRGAADIVAAGGSVIAQDEASSVVWGMPGAVSQAGHVSAVLPLDQIGPKIVRLFSGGRS